MTYVQYLDAIQSGLPVALTNGTTANISVKLPQTTRYITFLPSIAVDLGKFYSTKQANDSFELRAFVESGDLVASTGTIPMHDDSPAFARSVALINHAVTDASTAATLTGRAFEVRLQCDIDAYIGFDVAAAATNSYKILADTPQDFHVAGISSIVALRVGAADGVLQILEMLPEVPA